MKLQELIDTIDYLVTNKNHNGSILVSTENEIIYKKSFGYADIEKKVPISSKTQFLAGSVTKQFAAVAILKALFDRDKNSVKFKLNKTVEHYLNATHKIWNGAMPAWASVVTIHQLLIHASGIPNYTSLPDFEKQKFFKNSEIVNFFKGHELEFTPGEKFSYSNSGYYLLGIIIEEITQQDLDIYLEKTFFAPIGMPSSFLPMQGTVDELINTDAKFANLARGYQYDITISNARFEEIKRYERMEVPGAAGSLVSTAEDLLKWNKALYGEKIIPQFLLELMLHPYLVTERVNAYYGYGIEVMKSEALGTYYSHRGGIPGFRSILTYIPSLQLSIITLQNLAADQEKLMPEIKQIQASLPPDLSMEEHVKKLTDVIESKYPSIIENRERYEFAHVYESIIKVLDDGM